MITINVTSHQSPKYSNDFMNIPPTKLDMKLTRSRIIFVSQTFRISGRKWSIGRKDKRKLRITVIVTKVSS